MKTFKFKPIQAVVIGLSISMTLSCERLALMKENSQEGAMLLSSGQELFYSDYPHAFISYDTDEPVLINGVNIKRGPHKNSGGSWETPYINEEITAIGQSDAPDFNVIRIAMDWPYFNTAAGVFDSVAFGQLDILIDNAIEQGLYVILDPIHVREPGGACSENAVMAGARWNIPAWAWTAVGAPANPGGSCSGTTATSELMDDVLALQATADYLQYILTRYNASTARGQQVIAVDLVNEPRADGATAQAQFSKILSVYEDWLAPSGSKSLRAVNADKILIVTALHGDISLAGMDLSVLQEPNVVFTFHDYFARALSTSPTYGLGYSGSGFASQQERTYSSSPTPYDPAVLSYANRRAERRAYMQQYLDWLEAYQLPLYIGEYGILNPCAGGDAAFSAQYAADTYEVYSNLYVISGSQSIPIKMPRTWWTHGYWDGLALWYRSGTCNGTGPKEYFPYAMELTGELNLVANAGFEDDFAGWTTTGTIQVADVVANPANVRSGARSALSWSASAYSATLQSASATNTPAGTYTARVWSRAGGTFGTRELQVYINGSLAHQLTMPVTTTWTAYTISGITVPAGATIRLGISLNASGGAWTQFDDFEFRKN